jgi:hypothetical protein
METETMSLDSTQVFDRINVMKIQEATSYRCSDYLSRAPSNHADIWCRTKMIEWCFQVVDFIEFKRETVIIAVSYLDRFLSSRSERAVRVAEDRKEFQLAMMTALYTAIKLHEPKVIDTDLLVQLSQGGYTRSDFEIMEMDLLTGLNWRLSGPTSISFIEHFAVLLPFEQHNIQMDAVIESAKYQVEKSINCYDLIHHSPSKVAVAALVDGIKKFTTSPSLASVRTQLLNALEQISKTNLGSASLRKVLKIVGSQDISTMIQSRRHSAPKYMKPRCSEHNKFKSVDIPRSCSPISFS